MSAFRHGRNIRHSYTLQPIPSRSCAAIRRFWLRRIPFLRIPETVWTQLPSSFGSSSFQIQQSSRPRPDRARASMPFEQIPVIDWGNYLTKRSGRPRPLRCKTVLPENIPRHNKGRLCPRAWYSFGDTKWRIWNWNYKQLRFLHRLCLLSRLRLR